MYLVLILNYNTSIIHIQMWELDYKEGWVPKNWCFQRMVLGKMLESSLHCEEIKSVNPKGDEPWIFTGRTAVKVEAQHFGHLMQRTNSLGKIPMLGKIETKRRLGQKWIRWLDSITHSMDMNFSKPWESVKDREAWSAAVHGVTKSWTWLRDRTT